MMTQQHRQEALSLAYIQAVAAMCGLTHSFPSKDYGIDIRLHDIERRGVRFVESGVRLDIQAKSTTAIALTELDFIYDLDVSTTAQAAPSTALASASSGTCGRWRCGLGGSGR